MFVVFFLFVIGAYTHQQVMDLNACKKEEFKPLVCKKWLKDDAKPE